MVFLTRTDQGRFALLRRPPVPGASMHNMQDGGGHDLRRQGSRLQSPLQADVRPFTPSSTPVCPLHRQRPRAGRRARSRTQVGVLRRRFFVPRPKFKSFAELNYLARGPVHCLCQGEPAPRRSGQDDLGGVYRGASEPGALCRPVRRLPCRSGLRLQDLPRALRQEPATRSTPARSAVCRDTRLCRQAGMLAGWSDLSPAMIVPLGRGKTIYDPLHYIPVSARKPGALAQCGLRSRTGICHRPCAVCSVSSNGSPAVIGR